MEVITPSDYENCSQKRHRRKERPCDACRKRKTRCVSRGAADQCVHCQLRGSTCTYQELPPERPSMTLPSAGAADAGASGTSRAGPGTSDMMPTAVPARHPLSTPSLSQPITAHAAAPQPATKSTEQCGSESMTLGLSLSRFAELYGLGSDMEPILMRHRPYDPVSQEFSLETHSIRRVLHCDGSQVDYPLTFHLVSDEKAVEYDADRSEAEAIEKCVRPYGPGLVELFWRHVQPCYPLLHKDMFMQQYSTSYKSIPPPLLGAVYLSALRWWSYNPELSIHTPPDAAKLRKLVKQAIPTSYHRPKLFSIQAILLLLQCQPEDPLNPDHTYDWGLTCQALAVGPCLGLHLDASSWAIPAWEKNVRKRLSWALYMQDKWTALAYGRPVHIHHDDWAVGELANLDFLDCETVGGDEDRRTIGATGNLLFMHMVRLTQCLSTVLSSFYTARTSFGQDTEVLYLKARPLLDELQAWYASIPLSLQMSVTYQRKLCFHGYLHFFYYGVMMALLRRLIRSTALPPRCANDQILAELRQLALHVSQSAIAFVKSLRPDQLEAFWYFTSPYLYALLGSFTTLLLVTSLSLSERNFWQETLNSYLWNLRMMSKSNEPMMYAVNRLEGAILRGLEHALAVNINEPVNDNVSPAMIGSVAETFEYTDFGDWDLAADINGAFDFTTAFNFGPESTQNAQPK